MQPVPVAPAELQSLLAAFAGHGVVGVALGAKEVAGRMDFDTPAVTFFVNEKLPAAPGTGHLVDGRPPLPNSLSLDATRIATDVIPVASATTGRTGTRTGKPVFVPGGHLSGNGGDGTIAMRVRRREDGVLMVLTNHHVASAGTSVRFIRDIHPLMQRPVDRSILHGTRASLFGNPAEAGIRIRIDAAAITLAESQRDRVVNDVPHFGPIAAIARTASASAADYATLIGEDVVSYSRIAKQRFGTISNTHFQYLDGDGAPSSFCMLIRGRDNVIPGFAGDSGKLWMRRGPGGNEALGLHVGEYLDGRSGTRYAAATDIDALSRLWDFTLD